MENKKILIFFFCVTILYISSQKNSIKKFLKLFMNIKEISIPYYQNK